MGARSKLNEIYLLGIFVFAGIVGLSFQSWNAFLLTAFVLGIYCLARKDIRPDKTRRR